VAGVPTLLLLHRLLARLINKKAPIQINAEGKPCATDIEQHYVKLGRECLKAAYAKGEG